MLTAITAIAHLSMLTDDSVHDQLLVNKHHRFAIVAKLLLDMLHAHVRRKRQQIRRLDQLAQQVLDPQGWMALQAYL
jgi:hypothetical protein